MKKTLIIHPFLLPLSLIIFLLANNIDQLKYKIVLNAQQICNHVLSAEHIVP
jgi:hypothetical protein